MKNAPKGAFRVLVQAPVSCPGGHHLGCTLGASFVATNGVT